MNVCNKTYYAHFPCQERLRMKSHPGCMGIFSYFFDLRCKSSSLDLDHWRWHLRTFLMLFNFSDQEISLRQLSDGARGSLPHGAAGLCILAGQRSAQTYRHEGSWEGDQSHSWHVLCAGVTHTSMADSVHLPQPSFYGILDAQGCLCNCFL